MTLAKFLLARIAEDEEATRPAPSGPWLPDASKRQAALTALDGWRFLRCSDGMGTLQHIARWDPARVLAECEAKRQRVTFLAEMAAKCPEDDWPEDGDMALAPLSDMARHLLRLEALPHADHPDYREEWRP